jgi:hypothetical protein
LADKTEQSLQLLLVGPRPILYEWSNDAADATITSLAAGYYIVRVSDSDPTTDDVGSEITLTQPEPMSMEEMIPYQYTNGFNVSAYGACNGSITTNINGGTLPYSYRWEPGQQTVLSPTNLCGQENVLIVTDVNGCETNQGIGLSEPQRDDWTMTGNWGSNPATQFIGTLDNKDLSFRTFNAERFRIMGNGDVKINGLSGSDYSFLMVNSDGTIMKTGPGTGTTPGTPWVVNGNVIAATDFIGPKNNQDFIFKTGQAMLPGPSSLQERMRITKTGEVIINDTYISPGYKLGVNGKIICTEVNVRLRVDWPDYVFKEYYQLMSLEQLKEFIKANNHLPEIPTVEEVKKSGINTGEMNAKLLKKVEELTLYIFQLEERLNKLEKK